MTFLCGASILFVRKKDGAHNIFIDYHQLIKVTVNNMYTIPRIYKLFDEGVGCFSKLSSNSYTINSESEIVTNR